MIGSAQCADSNITPNESIQEPINHQAEIDNLLLSEEKYSANYIIFQSKYGRELIIVTHYIYLKQVLVCTT